MRTHRSSPTETTLAQAFTEDVLARAGIVPGMRVAVLGAGTGEVAFLAAERVGDGGTVRALERDETLAAIARRRAREQCFEHLELVGGFEELAAHGPFDAAIGRFYLMHRPEPVAEIRRSADLVRAGGRVVFAEWHFESLLWEHAGAWPDAAPYRHLARCLIDGLQRAGAHVDMGLRLSNAFVEAGLPLPAIRMDLRACGDQHQVAFAFLAETSRRAQIDARDLLERLRLGSNGSAGHAFLPLLVGAWARKEL